MFDNFFLNLWLDNTFKPSEPGINSSYYFECCTGHEALGLFNCSCWSADAYRMRDLW